MTDEQPDSRLTDVELEEMADMAFEIADSFARAVIEAKGEHTPGGWFDGTAKRFQDRGDVAVAVRYLELRFRFEPISFVRVAKDGNAALFKFENLQ